LRAINGEQAAQLIGVANLLASRSPSGRKARDAKAQARTNGGLWWSIPSAVDTAQILDRWLQEAHEAARAQGSLVRTIEATVHQLTRHPEGHWVASSAHGETLARAPAVVLCTGARSAELPLFEQPMFADPDEPGQPSRHAAVWAAAGWQCLSAHCSRSQHAVPEFQSVVGMQGIGHLLPLRDGHLLRGPRVGTDPTTLVPGIEPDATAFDPLAPGLRASVRDHLPLVGAWPDLSSLHRQWPALARNARLPLPRLPGLWTLSALGGRGLLWCLPAAEHLAACLKLEVSLLDARLSDAIDPARFLRRALRRGVPDLTHALGFA
jgi:tRNA 5-methylaminomethyl-2-thiouridine biosynthesis bifunctional protein